MIVVLTMIVPNLTHVIMIMSPIGLNVEIPFMNRKKRVSPW